MALPKKAKKKPVHSAAETLDQLETLGDRIAAWLTKNQVQVIAACAAILVVGGGFGLLRSGREESRVEASAALAAAQRDFRVAMGAGPMDAVVREPANPETAERVRNEFVDRFRQVADEYPDGAVAALALLQVGTLQQQLGRPDEALETWKEAADGLSPDDLLKALLSLRIAVLYEDRGDWPDAAGAYETAAAVESFPLRYGALADAARCHAEAGDVDRALAAFARVETEAPDYFVPEHISARLRELRATRHLN